MRTIGVTEWHGMIDEKALNPPQGYIYMPIGTRETITQKFLRSPIKGGFFSKPSSECDLVEAVVLPVITGLPWIYSTADFAEPMAFSLLGFPLPRWVRRVILERLFLQTNLKKIVFWSNAALQTMTNYGGISNSKIIEKATVIYPGIAHAPDRASVPEDCMILFSGQFFRKGGMHVVDAFFKLRDEFPRATLRICSDLNSDFVLKDERLRSHYLNKIMNDSSIKVGRVPRSVLMNDILPRASVYVLPSYEEAFGFAVLEALAHGVPVVASDIFAIPEMVDDGLSGYLLPFSGRVDPKKIVRGYGINPLDSSIHKFISDNTYKAIYSILQDKSLQMEMSRCGQNKARSVFSFESHNEKMKCIYDSALR